MNAVVLTAYGEPENVFEVRPNSSPAAPEADEVTLELIASPIHPSDLMLPRGQYGGEVNLPMIAGSESSARVVACGSEVEHLHEGDLVLAPWGEAWQEQRTVTAAALQALPSALDPLQAAMLRMIPATAWGLLETIVPLQEGDWVIQAAANSAVGRAVNQLASARGLRVLNLTRSSRGAEAVRAFGAEMVIARDELPRAPRAFAQAIGQRTEGAPIRLALDPVAGSMTRDLAAALTPGGTVAIYGALSEEPAQIEPQQLIFEKKKLHGFWLSSMMESMMATEIAAMFRSLIEYSIAGSLQLKVEAQYSLTEVAKALKHAERPGREGKILLQR